MQNPLAKLINTKILKAYKNENDSLHLLFEDESYLNINNKFHIDMECDVSSIANSRIVNVTETHSNVTFKFDSGQTLTVDLTDEGYNGPEAMELALVGQPLIVWN